MISMIPKISIPVVETSWRVAHQGRRAPVVLAFFAVVVLASLGCGGSEPPEPVEGKKTSPIDVASLQRQIGDIEFQLEALEQQSASMRGELEARIDQIDATRAVLATQVTKVRAELGKAEAKTPTFPRGASALPDTKAPSPAKQAVEKTEAPLAEASDEAKDEGGAATGFFKFILLIVFLGAIFFLSKYFFERWGVDEDGDVEPRTERVTELGKIRYPATAEQPDVFSRGAPDAGDAGGASNAGGAGEAGDSGAGLDAGGTRNPDTDLD